MLERSPLATIPFDRVGHRRVGEFGTVLAFSLAAFAMVIAGPWILDAYSVNVLTRSLLYACLALTVDLLWGYMGVLTFGQSAFFAAGSYAAGLIFTHVGFSAGTALAALVVGIIGAIVMAAIVAWLAFAHGVQQLYAAVVSLVLPIICTQLLFSGGNFTGSSSGLSGFDSFDLSAEAWFWVAGGIVVALTAISWLFVHGDSGRILVAIRENEQRCQYLGLNTPRLKAALFVACAAIAAIVGYVFACYTMVVSPELAGFVFGTQLVIFTVLGGRGTLIGPVLSTIVVDYESAQLSGDYPFVWTLILGAVFVVVIVALPKGLGPIVGGGLSWAQARLRGADGERYSYQKAPTIDVLGEAEANRTDLRSGAALQITDLKKHFGSLKVLDGINFSAKSGELVSLVGPNGAGKTTLIRCIADGMERSSGTIKLNGRDIGRSPPEVCVRLGVGRKFQTANVFDSLTVAECLSVARARLDRPAFLTKTGKLRLPPAAYRVMTATGLDHHLLMPANTLSHGMKQALELAMVLALEAGVILLDEPTAGLTKEERTVIGNILSDLARHHGLCVLLVEHDLDFVRQISSRVVVLHQGKILLDGTVQEVVESSLVRSIYAGSRHLGNPA
jgi:urea transport system permease protein/urea transport system ATP-binding protein